MAEFLSRKNQTNHTQKPSQYDDTKTGHLTNHLLNIHILCCQSATARLPAAVTSYGDSEISSSMSDNRLENSNSRIHHCTAWQAQEQIYSR